MICQLKFQGCQGKTHQAFFYHPRGKIETIQPERKATAKNICNAVALIKTLKANIAVRLL